jgi:hypothetical protein
MKHFPAILLFMLLLAVDVTAQRKVPRYKHQPRTEVGLVNDVVSCLRNRDTASYFNLFPPFDTLWHMVLHNPDHTPEAQKELALLRERPQSLVEFDPLYNHDIISRFCDVLAKGDDSGIIWKSVVLQRYELQKESLTRNLEGYDHIVPERFKGYVFLRDLLSRRTFCVPMIEIQKFKGEFFGGQVINILEASNIDDYLRKAEKERRYFAWLAANPDTASSDTTGSKADSAKSKNPLAIAREDNDDETKKRKEVIDRKYYEGKFDNEIPVKLYVRYMKDIGGKLISYDGLYKFGDQRSYIKLEIKREEDGKWLMEDDVPLGIMELDLKGRVYTGNWTNNDENGYDVVLTATPIPERKLEALDKILDQGASGRVDEEVFEAPQKTEKQKKREAAEEKEKKGKKDDDEPVKKRKKDNEDSSEKKKDKKDSDKNKDDKASDKQKDSEWDEAQEKAQKKERKMYRKMYKHKEQD